ncbi:hypothetical protein GUJ93_ZPchr0004g39432 [Zizania palustris]|uniref:Uncharacterized protein n=1 Tax=Zizania palustris TaxID=103762 RepID=A0A8J5VYS3_ZIZPA|nr:hypothetical protein GUJ93_ZPchr0004g39432 [Zizania palustris]
MMETRSWGEACVQGKWSLGPPWPYGGGLEEFIGLKECGLVVSCAERSIGLEEKRKPNGKIGGADGKGVAPGVKVGRKASKVLKKKCPPVAVRQSARIKRDGIPIPVKGVDNNVLGKIACDVGIVLGRLESDVDAHISTLKAKELAQGVDVQCGCGRPWTLQFRRSFSPEEGVLWNELMDMCVGVSLSIEGDEIVWELDKKGFSSKSLYQWMSFRGEEVGSGANVGGGGSVLCLAACNNRPNSKGGPREKHQRSVI